MNDVSITELGEHKFKVDWESCDDPDSNNERWEFDTQDHLLHYHYHESEGGGVIGRLMEGGLRDYKYHLGPLKIVHRSSDDLLHVCWNHNTDCTLKKRLGTLGACQIY